MNKEESSFRDPDAIIVYKDKVLYRIIYESYKPNYELLINSGLLELLINKKLIIPHTEVTEKFTPIESGVYKIIQPNKIPFISYPYEWSFTQWKEAALLTLKIQELALQKNLTLKDASAFNVQFIGNQAVFIDTTSFEKYQEGEPWQAYKQFCEHFLCPLLLMKYGKEDVCQLFQTNLEGISLSLTSKLLPWKTQFNLFTKLHIHLHAAAEQKHNTNKNIHKKRLHLSKNQQLNLLQHLQQGIKKLDIDNKTEWLDYYQTCSYNEINLQEKKVFVEQALSKIEPELVFDAGCNEGLFSNLATNFATYVIACDNDKGVVDRISRNNKKKNLLPLCIDLSNPTPAIGWMNIERKSFLNRLGDSNTCLALALIHHLAIGNNVPLSFIAQFFAKNSSYLIIEFVPKSDPQSQRLLVTRKDVFHQYTLEEFIKQFSLYFEIIEQKKLSNSERILFCMKRMNESN